MARIKSADDGDLFARVGTSYVVALSARIWSNLFVDILSFVYAFVT